jgi:hypothetical protein
MKSLTFLVTALSLGLISTTMTFAGTETFGSGKKVTTFKYGKGVTFRNGNPKKITLSGGNIAISGYERTIAMSSLIVQGAGGSFRGNDSRLNFPSTSIAPGASLILGDNVLMSLGSLSSGGTLVVQGDGAEVAWTGTCAELRINWSSSQQHGSLGTNYLPVVTVGHGSTVGTATVEKGSLYLQKSLAVNHLAVSGSIFFDDCSETAPLTVRESMAITDSTVSLLPTLWGRPPLMGEYVLISYAGPGPIAMTPAVRTVLEARRITLYSVNSGQYSTSYARYSFSGGDGNDISLLPATP